jgi:hypothetical protein
MDMNLAAAFDSNADPEEANSWARWQHGVMSVIRAEFEDLFGYVDRDDVDWNAWRPLYDEGRSPKAAVERAFTRDL